MSKEQSALGEVVQDATQTTQAVAQKVEKSTDVITTQASETVKEVAHVTTETLEAGTNQALQFLGIPVDVGALISLGMDWGLKLFWALLIFFVGKWIGERLVNMAKLAMKRSRLDDTASTFLGNILYGLMLVAVALAALGKLGVNTNSFVAVLGAATIAVGMALKDQLGKLAAGVMIVMFRPFNRGDTVEIAGKLGTVIDITLVNTRIRTANNHEIIIPNGDIMTNASTNFSSLPNRRLDVLVGISYDSDVQQARQLMIEAAKAHELVLSEPEPMVRVTALADSSVNLTLYVWTQNGDWFFVQCDLLEAIKERFDAHGVNLPFPQRSVHLEGLQLDKLAQALQQKSDKTLPDKTPSDNTHKEA